MPTIFTKDGYRFFFYSNDHEPIHVHVRRGGSEAVLDVSSEIAVRASIGMKPKELRRAIELADEHRQLIIESWNEHLNR